MTFHTAEAQQAANWVRTNVPEADHQRAVCLAALKAVGKLRWKPNLPESFRLLLPDNFLVSGNHVTSDREIGCVCYAAPVAFAVLGGALSMQQANQLCTAPEIPGLSRSDSRTHYIYQRFSAANAGNIALWAPGSSVPPGAMVYHETRANVPAAHVTMYIGDQKVVSCWAALNTQSAIKDAWDKGSSFEKIHLNQCDELQRGGRPADTVVLPIESFGIPSNNIPLRYTDRPFWHLW